MSALRDDLLAYVDRESGHLSMSEADLASFFGMPDEVFEMADLMAGPGANLEGRAKALNSVMQQVLKMAEGGGDGELVRMVRTAMARHPEPATTKPQGTDTQEEPAMTMTFAESRPDVQLAKLANEIRLSEQADYATALRLAKERDPELARRYHDDFCGLPDPAGNADRPDVELAERTKQRVERDGVSYSCAMALELSEDPQLASRYRDGQHGADARRGPVRVRAPHGMRLVDRRADVELAGRVRARQAADRVSWSEAERLVLAEDPALAVRYRDFTAGRTALEEATYRAETIQAVSRGRYRMGFDKAMSCALAEDPTLREGVGAYFEKAT